MPDYNLALLPKDSSFQAHFRSLAHAYFKDTQDGYLLGPNALAHVTLCQFGAPSDQDAKAVFTSIPDRSPLRLAITGPYVHDGIEKHTGFFWSGFLIEKTPLLIDWQKAIYERIAKTGHRPYTAVETYLPHITLARLSQRPLRTPTAQETPTAPIAFRLALGHSTGNGVFLREVAP